ncbi:hypothetical protein Tco_0776670 [Tanacetum coccineum]
MPYCETESEDDNIPQAVKKFKQLESDEELARKIKSSDEDFNCYWVVEEGRPNHKRMNTERIPPKEKRYQSRNPKKNVKEEVKRREVKKEKALMRSRKDESEEINLNVVTRSNGQKRWFSTLIGVLSVFDREDLDAVYRLVMDIYQDKIPEGFDKVLWGDLTVMFNPDEQDEF